MATAEIRKMTFSSLRPIIVFVCIACTSLAQKVTIDEFVAQARIQPALMVFLWLQANCCFLSGNKVSVPFVFKVLVLTHVLPLLRAITSLPQIEDVFGSPSAFFSGFFDLCLDPLYCLVLRAKLRLLPLHINNVVLDAGVSFVFASSLFTVRGHKGSSLWPKTSPSNNLFGSFASLFCYYRLIFTWNHGAYIHIKQYNRYSNELFSSRLYISHLKLQTIIYLYRVTCVYPGRGLPWLSLCLCLPRLVWMCLCDIMYLLPCTLIMWCWLLEFLFVFASSLFTVRGHRGSSLWPKTSPLNNLFGSFVSLLWYYRLIFTWNHGVYIHIQHYKRYLNELFSSPFNIFHLKLQRRMYLYHVISVYPGHGLHWFSLCLFLPRLVWMCLCDIMYLVAKFISFKVVLKWILAISPCWMLATPSMIGGNTGQGWAPRVMPLPLFTTHPPFWSGSIAVSPRLISMKPGWDLLGDNSVPQIAHYKDKSRMITT